MLSSTLIRVSWSDSALMAGSSICRVWMPIQRHYSGLFLQDMLIMTAQCCLIAYILVDVSIVNDFAMGSIDWRSVWRKQRYFTNDTLAYSPPIMSVTIANRPLKAVNKFYNLGGTISQNDCISKANGSFGHLHVQHYFGIRLSIKIQISSTMVFFPLASMAVKHGPLTTLHENAGTISHALP